MDYFQIGQRIRKLRRARGLSQEELVEKVNISVTHMSHIETGNTKLSLPVFVEIARALEVGADDLLGQTDEKTASKALAEIAQVLEGCTAQEARVIADVAKAAKAAMDQFL